MDLGMVGWFLGWADSFGDGGMFYGIGGSFFRMGG